MLEERKASGEMAVAVGQCCLCMCCQYTQRAPWFLTACSFAFLHSIFLLCELQCRFLILRIFAVRASHDSGTCVMQTLCKRTWPTLRSKLLWPKMVRCVVSSGSWVCRMCAFLNILAMLRLKSEHCMSLLNVCMYLVAWPQRLSTLR